MNELWNVLLQSSLRACAAAAGVGLALGLFRVRSAPARHRAWAAVVFAMLLMAPVRSFLPGIPLRVGAEQAVAPLAMVDAPVAPAAAVNTPAVPSSIAPAPAETRAVAPAARISWTNLALAIYLLGLFASLGRMFAGWRAARNFVRSCEPAGDSFDQSPRTVTPVTAGIFRARPVLPADWREWPQAKLGAALAHESAHARRRDNLVNAVALFNRAVFWFHPLSWWLRRKLAALAEQACDEAALEAAGGNRSYAAVLLELADAARRNGGRLAWQSGMAGEGGVERRIARILNEAPAHRTSFVKRASAATCCVLAIVFAAACQRQIATAPLRENPLRVTLMSNQQAAQRHEAELRGMTAGQAAALEARLAKNPEDLALRETLLSFYHWRGVETMGEAKTVEARRGHILWLIEHHPESDLLARERISPTNRDPLADPAGYAQAKKLWLERVARADTPPAVLGNAAQFFTVEDKPLAEKMLLRAQQIDPSGRWSQRLGSLYYETIVGSNASMPMGVVRSVSAADARGAFAAEVRQKLSETKDVQLLNATGELLAVWGRRLFAAHEIDFDSLPLGVEYLQRALALDPQSIHAHQGLALAHNIEKGPGWRTLPATDREAAISQLPESERFLALAQVAELEYYRADNAEYQKHDAAAAKPHWDNITRYAEESLELAKKFASAPDYGTAIFTAHMALGMDDMHEGNRRAAADQLLAAGEAPSTETLAYTHQMGTDKLSGWLLKDGAREPVLRFLERFAQTDIAERKRLLDAAAQIRAGVKPIWIEPTRATPPASQ